MHNVEKKRIRILEQSYLSCNKVERDENVLVNFFLRKYICI